MNFMAKQRKIDFVDTGLIVWLWRQGYDTCDIARRLQFRECEVYNLLLHLREGGR